MKICVFASSSSLMHDMYVIAASELGKIIVAEGYEVIYGGGETGLMGVLADTVLREGGKITGVIPRFMKDEGWGHRLLTEMRVTEDMHTRKKTMFSGADSVIALPGGIGTLEELTEAITLKQLGLFNGPIVILNTLGFYDLLLKLLDKMISENFLRPKHKEIWSVASTPAEALDKVKNYGGWIDSPRSIARI